MKQYDPQDYRGKVLIVEFMQTTCEHCQQFAAVLEEARAKYGDKIAILSIVHMPDDNGKTVPDFVAKFKVKSPILFDSGQVAYSYLKPPMNGAAARISIPHVFLIDGAGMIRSDFAYTETTKNFFQPKGLFAELDKVIAGK